MNFMLKLLGAPELLLSMVSGNFLATFEVEMSKIA